MSPPSPGLIHTAQQFYWIRFSLGVAEAGFVPGILVYLSHWYRPEDRGKAIAMFFASVPASQVLGGPLAAVLLKIHWLGLPGWRWLLLLEGIPATVLGIVTLFYLTEKPRDAKWLRPDEREWLAGELEKEQAAKTTAGFGLESSGQSARPAAGRDSVHEPELDVRRQPVAAENGAEAFDLQRFDGEPDCRDSLAVLAAAHAADGLAFGPYRRADLARGDSAIPFGRRAAGVLLLDDRRPSGAERGDAVAGDHRVLLRASRILAAAQRLSGQSRGRGESWAD